MDFITCLGAMLMDFFQNRCLLDLSGIWTKCVDYLNDVVCSIVDFFFRHHQTDLSIVTLVTAESTWRRSSPKILLAIVVFPVPVLPRMIIFLFRWALISLHPRNSSIPCLEYVLLNLLSGKMITKDCSSKCLLLNLFIIGFTTWGLEGLENLVGPSSPTVYLITALTILANLFLLCPVGTTEV